MAAVIHREQALRDQLSEHAAPRGFGQIAADAEGGERLVVPLFDALGRIAAQDIDELASAKAHATGLLHAVCAGQRHLRLARGVPGLRRSQARIAVAARLAAFTKVRKQGHTAAACGFAQAEQRFELGG